MKRGFLVKLGNLIYHGGCNEATTSAAMSMIRKEVKI